jgi:hypothetical protein
MKEVGRFLRETIGDIPAFLIGLVCGLFTLFMAYKHWKSGNELEFEDYVILIAGLLVVIGCSLEIYSHLT